MTSPSIIDIIGQGTSKNFLEIRKEIAQVR